MMTYLRVLGYALLPFVVFAAVMLTIMLLPIIAVAGYLLLRRAHILDALIGFPKSTEAEPMSAQDLRIAGIHSLPTSGELPYSIAISGAMFRFHSPQRIFHGEEFYKTFLDDAYRWSSRGRFSGISLNCGHHFGLSVESARVESLHYGRDPKDAVLLEVEAASKKVLDLTSAAVIREVFDKCVNHGDRHSWDNYLTLQELVEKGNQGNIITDYIGVWAAAMGYDAIIFYSTRVFTKLGITTEHNRNLGNMDYDSVFAKLAGDGNIRNLVALSGANLVDRITRYRIDGGPWMENLLHRKGRNAIEKLSSEFGPDFQEQKRRRGVRNASKPIYYYDSRDTIKREQPYVLKSVVSRGCTEVERAAMDAIANVEFQRDLRRLSGIDEWPTVKTNVETALQDADFTLCFGALKAPEVDAVALKCLIHARSFYEVSGDEIEDHADFAIGQLVRNVRNLEHCSMNIHCVDAEDSAAFKSLVVEFLKAFMTKLFTYHRKIETAYRPTSTRI